MTPGFPGYLRDQRLAAYLFIHFMLILHLQDSIVVKVNWHLQINLQVF